MKTNGWNVKDEKGHSQSEETKKKISATMKGKKKTPEHQAKITKALTGRVLTKEWKEKISKAHTGMSKPWVKTALLGRHNSPETEFKPGDKPWISGKTKDEYPQISHTGLRKGMWTGDKNPNWKGGITPINKYIRTTSEYKDWRRDIFIRDEFTCQECGITNIYIEVHHIKSFAKYPELRLEPDNGITLCKSCHSKTDNYRGRTHG